MKRNRNMVATSKAGVEIKDIYEDCDGGGLFDKYMMSYVIACAVKK